jgi:DNA-binding beta-propeller fold protein YncE
VLAALLLAMTIILLTVVVPRLRPGAQTGSASAFGAQPIAVWGGAPPPVVLRSPSGVAVGDDEDIYVADTGEDRLVKLSPTGRLLAEWGGTGSGAGTFRGPTAVTVNSHGQIFVADSGNDQIQKLSPLGTPLGQWTGLHPDVATQMGRYHRPTSVAIGANGVQYILYLTDPAWNWVAGIDDISGSERYFSFTTSGPPGGIAANDRGDFAATIPTAGRIYLCRPNTYMGATQPILEQECHGYGRGLFQDPEGIALDAHDDMYVTDRARDRIVKISPTGQLLSVWGSRGSSLGQFNAPIGVAVDRQGNVYVADTGNNRIQKLSTSGIPLSQWGRPQPAIRLRAPSAIAADHAGHVYAITNDGGQQITKITEHGALVGRWEVAGVLSGLTVGADGFLYVVDSLNSQIVRVSATGKVLARWGKVGSGTAELSDPSAIASDRHGYLYVADAGNTRIVGFKTGSRAFANWRQVVGPAAALIQPAAIAADRDGDLFVADAANHRIAEFSPQGAFVREWSVPSPVAIAVDSAGHVYVADANSSRVLLFTLSGRLQESLGSRGSRPGQFQGPQGLAVDQTDNFYVADNGNDRIQVFRPPH